MTEAKFISKNEESWKALEAFNRRAVKGGIKTLNPDDVKEFARLFRLASHNLAYAKTHYPTSNVLPYLNRVVGVTHNYFYVRQSRSIKDVLKYFTNTFPSAVRETWRFWAVAAALFVFGFIFAWFYVAADLYRLNDIMPGGMGGFEVGETPEFGYRGIEDYSLFAAMITTNNIAVSFNAVAGGLLAGLGTILILIYNGLIVGGLFGFLRIAGADMVTAHGLIWPHGVVELMAIFLAGGCGLMLGKGLLLPGDYTRRQSLIMQTRAAAKLIPGIIMLLVVGGLIEGYFTPLPIDPIIKLIFAGFTFVCLAAYFMRGVNSNG